MRAALELIAKKGPAGFTFAEAARWAGVSPAAPYRHFRDRDELLADVALRGFEQFEAVLAKAWDDGRPDPIDRVRPPGQGLSDVRAQRACLLLGHVRSRYPARHQARNCARPATALSRYCAPRPSAWPRPCRRRNRPPVLMMALHIWATVARHRLAVWPRRCRPAAAADVGRGTAGGGRADLSARSRLAGGAAALDHDRINLNRDHGLAF